MTPWGGGSLGIKDLERHLLGASQIQVTYQPFDRIQNKTSHQRPLQTRFPH